MKKNHHWASHYYTEDTMGGSGLNVLMRGALLKTYTFVLGPQGLGTIEVKEFKDVPYVSGTSYSSSIAAERIRSLLGSAVMIAPDFRSSS